MLNLCVLDKYFCKKLWIIEACHGTVPIWYVTDTRELYLDFGDY